MSERYVGSGTHAESPAVNPRVCVHTDGQVWVSVRSRGTREHCLGIVPGVAGLQ